MICKKVNSICLRDTKDWNSNIGCSGKSSKQSAWPVVVDNCSNPSTPLAVHALLLKSIVATRQMTMNDIRKLLANEKEKKCSTYRSIRQT
jgi:hypothetical protein